MSGDGWSRSPSVGRLLGGVKKLKIDDQDSSTPSRLRDAFPNHWSSISSSSPSPATSNAKIPITICSDINCTEDRIACGLSNGDIVLVDTSRPVVPISGLSVTKGKRKKGSSSNIPPTSRRHRGLTSLVCSKTRPELVYSASAKEGTVRLWDFRVQDLNPTHTFSVGSSKIGGDAASTESQPRVRPILCIDVSSGDQVVCAGTELMDEDSFILFWDVRMPSGGGEQSGTGDKLLGAYWESHSDDVTSVRFHPEKFNSLATGSTDGLLNLFDLLQPSEDDALLYSFNTESSVESIQWSVHPSNADLPSSCLTCVTHCNQVQLWDADSGDKFANFDRTEIAQAMMRSNPDAAFVNRCYRLKTGQDCSSSDTTSLGLLTCSLKGSCTRFVTIDGKKLEPSGLFLNQNAIVQTAEYVSNCKKWVTFDEEGNVRAWSAENTPDSGVQEQVSVKRRKKEEEETELTTEKNALIKSQNRKSNKNSDKKCLF